MIDKSGMMLSFGGGSANSSAGERKMGSEYALSETNCEIAAWALRTQRP
jgi:hypothetical protein